jgi:hypothetical protein
VPTDGGEGVVVAHPETIDERQRLWRDEDRERKFEAVVLLDSGTWFSPLAKSEKV